MKTRIYILAIALLAAQAVFAQNTTRNPQPVVFRTQQRPAATTEKKTASVEATPNTLGVTFQVGQSICFTKTGYYEGYEILQASARVQLNYVGFIAGVGIDFPEDNTTSFDLSFRGGYSLEAGKFNLDIYGILQRGMNHEEDTMTLAGGGLLAGFNIKGPVSLFMEYRSMYPMFIRATNPYYNRYYRATVAYLTFGVAVSF